MNRPEHFYCEWTLDDGADCMMLAVAEIDVDGRPYFTCMPHAREFYTWLVQDVAEGKTVETRALYRTGDGAETAMATRALNLMRVGSLDAPYEFRLNNLPVRIGNDREPTDTVDAWKFKVGESAWSPALDTYGQAWLAARAEVGL